jgi:antirestriction protein ArdC
VSWPSKINVKLKDDGYENNNRTKKTLRHTLREENRSFVRASALAQKAADFILNRIEIEFAPE